MEDIGHIRACVNEVMQRSSVASLETIVWGVLDVLVLALVIGVMGVIVAAFRERRSASRTHDAASDLHK
jgi:hypothetical protein